MDVLRFKDPFDQKILNSGHVQLFVQNPGPFCPEI